MWPSLLSGFRTLRASFGAAPSVDRVWGRRSTTTPSYPVVRVTLRRRPGSPTDARGGSPMTTTATWDAEHYDRSFGYVSVLARGVVDVLAPRPGERILDLGCGTGELTAVVAAAS